jgi:ribosomal-protein-alanine N-acetyltransferase
VASGPVASGPVASGPVASGPVASGPVASGPVATVVGYVVAWLVADEAEVANLAVAPEWRGRGVGAALLDAALNEARKGGAHVAHLEVRDSNVAARALYGSRGFMPVGRRRRYYQAPVEDAVLLRCDLRRRDGAGARQDA